MLRRYRLSFREMTLIVGFLVTILIIATATSLIVKTPLSTPIEFYNKRRIQQQRRGQIFATANDCEISNTKQKIFSDAKYRRTGTTYLCLSTNGDNNNHDESDLDDDGTGSYSAAATVTTTTSSSATVVIGSVWNPNIRKAMGGLASLGAIETIYLTFSSLHHQNDVLPFCSSSSSSSTTMDGSSSLCDSVLSGPYAYIPGTDIPLALLGAIAYLLVLGLAVTPLLLQPTTPNPYQRHNNYDDSTNRVLLLTTATSMGIFAVFLMSILFNVLHQSCVYCIASATFSIGLMILAWLGGALPAQFKNVGVSLSVGGGLLSSVVALIIVGTNIPTINADNGSNAEQTSGASTTTLLASAQPLKENLPSIVTAAQKPPLLVDQAPPDITTESTTTALALSTDLQKLDARFYGAYWCSHCYDQKQAFGKEAMQRIPYVECSREGKNEQAALCKEKKIPGYPTWEIAGKLYPGEKALYEIRDIVVLLMK